MVLSLIDLLLYGRVLGVIRAFGNSVIFLMILNTGKWHNFNCACQDLNGGIFGLFKRSS